MVGKHSFTMPRLVNTTCIDCCNAACDCWDAEILMSSGWIECVGIADRSAYDLKVHTKATKVELVAREVFPEPRMEEVVVMKANNGLLGRNFKGDNALVLEGLNNVR
jgi:glycyl-tRNA synthetase